MKKVQKMLILDGRNGTKRFHHILMEKTRKTGISQGRGGKNDKKLKFN
jgi:hypothetical protein